MRTNFNYDCFMIVYIIVIIILADMFCDLIDFKIKSERTICSLEDYHNSLKKTIIRFIYDSSGAVAFAHSIVQYYHNTFLGMSETTQKGPYFFVIYPCAFNNSAHSTAPPAAPRNVLCDSPTNFQS